MKRSSRETLSRTLVLTYVLAATLFMLVVGTIWLFTHYVYPGAPVTSQRTLHGVVFLTQPVAGIGTLLVLTLSSVTRQMTRRRRRVVWGVVFVCGLVGIPLWMLSWVV